MLKSLYGKLVLALLVLVSLLGVAFLFVVRFAADYYYQEITQRLNSSIVEYILQHEVLMQDGEPNLSDWKDLAHTVMIVNPTVEVYLLDRDGRLLAYDAPEEKIRRRQVDVAPIKQFLAANAPMPTRGDDPRSDDARKLFAAAALEEDGELSGYVYAILSSERYQAVAQNIASNFMLRLSLIGVVVSALFAFLAGLLIFNFLTRRLRQLTRTVEAYRASDFSASEPPRLGKANGDEVDRLALAYSDMSERIIDQVNALKRLDGLRRELVTNVSHDLRTPLAAMLGYLETLQLKQPELDEEGRQHYLTIARRHGEQLNRLVDQLFELSQLDSEQVGAKAEPFSLTELIFDITQTYQLRAEASQITLEAELDRDTPWVVADIAQIQRVLENLIDNAIKHTDPGDRVIVHARAGQAKLDGEVEVMIEDTGRGIPAADLPHVFERLYRAPDPGSGAAANRTGLGLAIVKRALDLHAREITVTSTPGEGTTFRFTLPAFRA